MWVIFYLILYIGLVPLSINSYTASRYNKYHSSLYANPVTAESNNLRGDITEKEAFLWFDEALVYVRAGSGGSGSNAVKFGKARQHVAPSGGNGGNGGDVIFEVDNSFNTLLGFRGKSFYRAENGDDGDLEYANGLNGDDCIVQVPKGTIVRDNITNEIITELSDDRQKVIIAKGGIGGRGNAALKTKNEKGGSLPPQGGEKKWLKLELKLVADIGLVGVPNAGKSTLLDAITNAKPKIAPYPFTTIVPNLGVCDVSKHDNGLNEGMTIADIPGLLEGAHKGVGLGRGFLRHVERCKIIIHIINGDSMDPVADFNAINRELQLFSPTLAMKPQIVVLNKIDLLTNEQQEKLLNNIKTNMKHSRLLAISAAGRVGLDILIEKTYLFLKKIKSDDKTIAINNEKLNQNKENLFKYVVQDNVIEVHGESISAILIEEDEYIKSSNKFGGNDNNLRDRFDAVVDALEIIPTLEQIFSTQNLNKNNVLIKARSNMTNIKNEIYYKIHENVLRPTQVSLKKNNIFII
jgi:GTP-binding protein